MPKYIYLLLLVHLCLMSSLKAQTKEDYQKEEVLFLWQERLSKLAEVGLLETAELEEAYANLEYYSSLRLRASDVSLEELLSLPFLTEYQAREFITYRTNLHQIAFHKEELKSLSSWDEETIRCIEPILAFDTLEEMTESLVYKQRNELYLRQGFRNKAYSEQSFAGPPSYSAVKLAVNSFNNLKLSLSAERDYGESWQFSKNMGFDSYAGAIVWQQNLINSSKDYATKLILGDYRASFGEGLCLNLGFRPMKGLTRLPYKNMLREVSTMAEARKFRGLAYEQNFKQWKFSLLLSSRRMDGRLEGNSLTALTDVGLHRTAQEVERRNAVGIRTIAGQVSYSLPLMRFDVQHIYFAFEDGVQLARATGASEVPELAMQSSHYNSSVSGNVYVPSYHLTFSGELARNSLGAYALSASMNVYNSALGELMLHYNHINSSYWGFYAQAYTQALRPNNEESVSCTWQSREFIPRTKMTVFGEMSRKMEVYGKQLRTNSYNAFLRLQTSLTKSLSLDGNLAYKRSLQDEGKWRLSLKGNYLIDRIGLLQLGLCTTYTQEQWGKLLYLKNKLNIKANFSLSCLVLYHDFPLWQGRTNIIEPQLRYSFGSIPLYRKGYRAVVKAQYQFRKSLSLALKSSYHYYYETNTKRMELSLFLRYLFE